MYIFQYLPGTPEERIKPSTEETAVVENLASCADGNIRIIFP
jgi:hypothetical protein